MKPNRFGFLACLLLFLVGSISAEDQKYPSLVVKEFKNEKVRGALYYIPPAASPDAVISANDLVFDPDGNPIILQWAQGLLYFPDKKNWSIKKVVKPELPLDFLVVEHLVGADGKRLFFWNYYGLESAVDYSGKAIFRVDLQELALRVPSYYYHAGILFLTDNHQKLHSVANPSMDQDENKKNYRDPDNTKKLFEMETNVDLEGLTMDANGELMLSGSPFDIRLQYLGNYAYFRVDPDNVSVWDGKKRVMVSMQIDSEVGESTAIHPSGDIYFLRFNKARNVHILYKIENTWDPEIKKTWESRK